ncbi:MAG: hypothetical protein QM778_27175 [Myxococcales bacterium]
MEDRLSERLAEGLFVPRAGGYAVSPTGITNETWIIGGAPSLAPGTLALNSFERIDQGTREVLGLGRLRVPRVHARALALPDGSVLVAGGESSVGSAGTLTTLERVAAGSVESQLEASLPWSGSLDAMLLRDDGVVVLAGRAGVELRLALFDPKSQQVASLSPPSATWDPNLVVTLPGARIALIETAPDALTGELHTTGALWLLLPDGSQLHLDHWFSSFSDLTNVRTATLDDGRILLSGSSSAGAFSARVIDPGRSDVRPRPLAALPAQLLARNDGSIVMLADNAVALLRESARTPYDNPGGTLLADDTADTSVLALDAPQRFRREGVALVSTAALARFDVALLRYDDVRVDVRASGPTELLLRRADGAESSIELGSERVGPALCSLDSDPSQVVRLERQGESLRIRTARAERTCQLAGLTGAISVAVRALEPDVRIDDLEVTRF